MSVAELLEKLISFRSITPNDDGAMEFIEAFFPDFEAIRVDKEGVKNLFLYKRFGAGVHLCFAGHIDVVPPGSGWESEPFVATKKDGYIHGRGAQDMKGGLSAMMGALKSVESFSGTLSLLVTSDEEGDAYFGTLEMLKHLKKIEMMPDFAILAEPTCEHSFGDTIKNGRRGSINGVLELMGVQGHAAYPEKSKNPIDMIAPILYKIAGAHLDSGDEFFPPSRLTITDIRAGMEVTNVTPERLKLMFNVRNSTKVTLDDVKEYINEHFRGCEYTLDLKQTARPFVTDKSSKIVEILKNSIKSELGKEPKLSTAGGTSDARFFAEFGVESAEFGVMNDKIHSVNERVAISDVEGLERVFRVLLESELWKE